MRLAYLHGNRTLQRVPGFWRPVGSTVKLTLHMDVGVKQMRPCRSGFTLLELVIVVTIGAIMVTMALPGFASLLESNRRATTSNLLVASLMHARSEAVTRRHPVSVCPIDATRSCRDDPDWNAGWMVFLDAGRQGRPDSDDDILRVVERPEGASRLRIGTTSGRRLVRYQPTGTAGGSNLTLSICSADSGEILGLVVVNRTGRARYRAVAGESAQRCPY